MFVVSFLSILGVLVINRMIVRVIDVIICIEDIFKIEVIFSFIDCWWLWLFFCLKCFCFIFWLLNMIIILWFFIVCFIDDVRLFIDCWMFLFIMWKCLLMIEIIIVIIGLIKRNMRESCYE